MHARLLLNAFLLLCVLGLGAWFWLQPEPAQPPPDKISSLNIGSIKQLRIERPGEATIELVKQDGDWRLTTPLTADAEDDRVESVLLLAVSTSESHFPTADKNLAKFGLEPAPLTITLDEERFVIGDVNPLNQGQRYVLHDGQIHLMDGRLYQRLNAPLNYYVNPSLTPPDSELTRVRLPDGILSKRDDGWHVIPEDLSDSPTDVADHWQRARATYVQRYTGDNARYQPEITLEFAEHEAINYYLIETEPELILVRPEQGLEYHLRGSLARELLLAAPAETENPTAE